jgi:hypothetical protein
MAAGRRLEIGGKTLLKAGQDIMSVHVRYQGDVLEVSTRGRGVVRVARGRATRFSVDGKPVRAAGSTEEFETIVGEPGKIELSTPVFATDPVARCKGIGVPRGYGGVYQGPAQSALVSFKSAVPTDMIIQWRGTGETVWKRVVNPELTTDHYYLLPDLDHGTTYQVRLACRSLDGRVGELQKQYVYNDPKK